MALNEIWNEICFLLNGNIKKDISEKDYENQVIRAIEKLGWKEFTGEIKRQPEYKVGRKNKIRPDIAIYRADDEPLIMIEIKRPSEQLSKEEPADQLISYILQSQTGFGLLIGSSIRLYYNGKGNPQREPILLDRIAFNKDSEEGLRFVSIFNRTDFLKAAYRPHITELINKFSAYRNIKKLKEILVQDDTKKKIIRFLKNEYSEYGPDVIDGALSDLEIDLSFNGEIETIKNGITIQVFDDQKESLFKRVFETIKSNAGGVNKSRLLQLTGFSNRQVSNAVYKLNKRGAIIVEGRGLYRAISATIPPRKKAKVNSKQIKQNAVTKRMASIKGTIIDSVYNEIKKYKRGCTKDHLKEVFELEARQLSNAF